MRVLLLSRDRELGLLRASALRAAGHFVLFPGGKDEAVREIKRAAFEVVVLSYTLSNDTAIELHELINQNCPSCGIVIVTKNAWAEGLLEHHAAITGDEGPEVLIAAVESARQHQPFLVKKRW
jgi:DNA-binding NarL/FixJ family response regulator